jgi:four helix bundle protein
MKEKKFRRLEVWIRTMDFIENVYKITKDFPNEEMYGLTSQIRRAVLSIALNIAEGSGCGSDKEFKRFLGIALRSAYEVMCGFEVARRLNYCSEEVNELLLSECDEIAAMISGLQKKLRADS